MKKIMIIIVLLVFLASGFTVMKNNEKSANHEISASKVRINQINRPKEENLHITRSIANVTLDGIDRIISNNNHGTNLTANSYDENGSLMPIQNFNWSETIDGAALSEIYKNTARITAEPFSVGAIGDITLEHIETGLEFVFHVNITTGSPTSFEIVSLDSYYIEMMSVITASVYDEYNNIVVDYRGTVRITAVDGEFEIDEGNIYNYTSQDRGIHTFLITPHTWGEKSTTIRFADDDLGIKKHINISVIAGRLEDLKIQLDLDRMGWNGTPGEYKYFAGDPIYIKVRAVDMMGNPSSTPEDMIPLIVSHNIQSAGGILEPEPWQSMDGEFVITTKDWVKSYEKDPGWVQPVEIILGKNPTDTPIRFYEAGTWQIKVHSKWNLSLEGNITIQVNPSYLDSVIAYPDENPTVVQIGETQNFHVSGYDQYGNEVPIVEEEWSADKSINKIDSGTEMKVAGEFSPIEYFSGEYREGKVYVKAVGNRGTIVNTEIAVRVVNNYDLWIEEDEIEPGAVLKGKPLELKTNVHYYLPQNSLENNLLEIVVVISLVDENGEPIKDHNGDPFAFFSDIVEINDLDENPRGVKTVETVVQPDVFSQYLHWDLENIDNKNYLKVEIEKAEGGFDISGLEKTGDNNIAITGFSAITLPEETDNEIKESQDGSDYCLFYFIIIIVIIILCIVGTVFTLIVIFKRKKNKEETSLSPIGGTDNLPHSGTVSSPPMVEPEPGGELDKYR